MVDPHAPAPTECRPDGGIGGRDHEQHVADPGERPQVADRVGFDDRHGGQGPLADDHRVDELDRHVLGVLGQAGDQHHRVAPAANRRASANEAAASPVAGATGIGVGACWFTLAGGPSPSSPSAAS